jgi:carbon storage regulator
VLILLFLKRKPGEAILIDHDIEVRIHEIKGKYVNLAITFPDGTRVLRREVYERIEAENKKAAESEHLLSEIMVNKKI